MIFDDGSTIDFDTGAATPAPAGMLISDYPNNSGPGGYVPGGATWLDVLNTGIGHWASYKIATAPARPAASATQYANAAQPAPAASANMDRLMKWGLVALAGVLAYRALKG
jgi:hypothetical protein